MSKRATYPVNLLRMLRLNEETDRNIDYGKLNADQLNGLNYALSALTERETVVLRHYFLEGMTRAKIAKHYSLPDSRIKQIIDHALRKFRKNKEWLFYIADGYEARSELLHRQLRTEEETYCAYRRIAEPSHLYYQELRALNLSARIYRAFDRHGVKTVRDLLICLCSTARIRGLGEQSKKEAAELLVSRGFLPAGIILPCCNAGVPRVDLELRVFRELNAHK